jgi:hypothetical protein
MKDVLLNRGEKFNKNCLFCGQEDSINHLFFFCPLARYIWNIVSCASGLKCQFDSVENCFNFWLKSFGKRRRKMIWKTSAEPIEVLFPGGRGGRP